MSHFAEATTRRRFVEGLAVTSALGAFGWRRAEAAAASFQPRVLRGAVVDLVISPTPVNITGNPRIATLVNGSMPGPILRLREGDLVTINVSNRLHETTSIHWHGIRLPNAMDGVPGLTFAGIAPGETFTYRFPIVQTGTYWYHSHSGGQEQKGLSGPLILEPRSAEPYEYDRDYVVVLSDWTDDDPMTIVSNLKEQSDFYNFGQRTLGTFIGDSERDGLGATIKNRLTWGDMRMSPTDIVDVSGATYTFLVNGQPPAANWTALFNPGERVRLRFINSASMTTFDVRIPELQLTVIQADGSDVEPIEVDEFRIGVAETYDVIVQPKGGRAYTIFAQGEDRSGYARGTLAPRLGMTATIPPLDTRPLRTMTDMGMSNMAGMNMASMSSTATEGSKSGSAQMAGMAISNSGDTMSKMPSMGNMSGMTMGNQPTRQNALPTVNASGVDPGTLSGNPFVGGMAMETSDRLDEAGDGLDGNGRRVLRYSQLKALEAVRHPLEPTRAIEFHLTGNMQRFVWGFDGKKFSEAPPVRVKVGETVRFVLINDTMMEHPIHLHGFLFALENGQNDRLPLKHTVNVKPAERMSFVFAADVPGHWAFHCHLQYHMEAGMFRTVLVS